LWKFIEGKSRIDLSCAVRKIISRQLLIATIICLTIGLTSCGRAEGSKYLSGELINSPYLDTDLPTNVEPAVLGSLINYVDALNIALHTGNVLPIRLSAMTGCGCLKIADNFQSIYATSNLVGGAYKITSIAPVLNTPAEVQLKVRVFMSDTKHINRKSRKSENWAASNIDTTFIFKPIESTWWLVATE